MNLQVRRIGLISAARFGCVSGLIGAVPLGIVAALVARVAVGWLRRLLEGWQNSSIDMGLLGKIPVDMVTLLNLSSTLSTLRKLDDLALILVAVVFVVVVLVAGVLAALTDGWQAVVYNRIAAISGGLEVELVPEGEGKISMKRKGKWGTPNDKNASVDDQVSSRGFFDNEQV